MANNVKVTVLMPVYNSESYLHEAITSILNQDFKDFEFLIINDGSTDKSGEIISSFNDSRIRSVTNEKNIGLVNTLNKGIELANGEYIARMDNDDICILSRLSKQVAFLDSNSDFSLVAANVVLINADGKESGFWQDDVNTRSFDEIKSFLPKANCIAHPTVMIRSHVIKHYKFRNSQKGAEDWDMWMRLVSDGFKIGKINEVLLKYRIHPMSISSLNQTEKSKQEKIIRIKRNFLLFQLRRLRLNGFYFKVLYSYFRSVARLFKLYFLPDIMRGVKRIVTINPLKVFGSFYDLKKYLSRNTHSLIFFFPYTHVGGAERVHADIMECVNDKKPLVFFTGFSMSKSFLVKFEANGKVFNIPEVLNYPWVGNKTEKLLLEYINAQPNAQTFGCNSAFYYGMASSLANQVKCFDLKHSFIYPDNGAEKIFLPAAMRMNTRVYISKVAILNTVKFYNENNIPSVYSQRLKYIPNCVSVPAKYCEKPVVEKLKVIYVGRGSAEKRVHLVGLISNLCKERDIPVSFQIIGDVGEAIVKSEYPDIEFMGEITEENVLNAIYRNADIVLITSTTEGFPMSIMEGMAFGVVPISTNVGDVPIHIKNNENGFITTSNESDAVVEEIAGYIEMLSNDRRLLRKMSENAYFYSKENFSKENFRNAYRSLFGF